MGSFCSNSNLVVTEKNDTEEKEINVNENEFLEPKQEFLQSEYSPLPALSLPSMNETENNKEFRIKLFDMS